MVARDVPPTTPGTSLQHFSNTNNDNGDSDGDGDNHGDNDGDGDGDNDDDGDNDKFLTQGDLFSKNLISIRALQK